MRMTAIGGLILTNLAFSVLSNIGFKWSALSVGWRGFLWWQVVGNISGFLSVLAFTFLLRFIPLYLAFTAGLGFIAVQIVGASLVFRETISSFQWVGMFLIAGGIVIVSLGK